MGDSGEGLIDAEARIQERMEELERERREKREPGPADAELIRARESLRLARADLERQLAAAGHARRRAVLMRAMAELDRRMAELATHHA